MAITLNINTKSYGVRGRPTLKLVERRSANFTIDQFTSDIDPLRVNLLLRNIKRNQPPILCLHVNTTVYLDVIDNPAEYQKLL